MSWLKKAAEVKKEETERQDRAFGPDRLFVKRGSKKDLVFVDDEPGVVYEHCPKINGRWGGNELTCSNTPEAVCCEILSQKGRYACFYYTVVDCEEWTDRNGKVHKYELKFFPAKFGTQGKLDTKKGERGGLAGWMITARRYTDQKEPKVGSEHEWIREIEDMAGLFEATSYKGKKLSEIWDKAEADPDVMERLKKTFQLEFDEDDKLLRKVVPFNYFELLKPLSDAAIRGALASYKSDNQSSSGGGQTSGTHIGDSAEDDVPF